MLERLRRMQKRVEIASIVEFIVGGRIMQSLHDYSPSFNLNCARLGLLDLGEHQREHAVLQFGSDLVLVDLARKTEAARIVADVVLVIDRLQTLIFEEIQ